jgi:hypothetical protein
MSDRKYRQRGYQEDEARERERQREHSRTGQKPKGGPRERPEGPRTPNMPGFRSVVRCHRCGTVVNAPILVSSTCSKCGVALHACAECESFNPAARFECMQAISARVSPKDSFNTCAFFEPRTTVERETGAVRQSSARSAFDDLFKI